MQPPVFSMATPHLGQSLVTTSRDPASAVADTVDTQASQRKASGKPAPPSAAGGARRWRWYALAAGLFVLALLSKTVTASLPVALLIVLWWKRRRLTVKLLKRFCCS